MRLTKLSGTQLNNKFKELAEQAGAYTDVSGRWVNSKGMEKFAELIVRECMKICQNHPSIIFKNEWDADVVSTDIVHRLESHFGVEE